MINKLITLENNEKYLIILKETIDKDEFLVGVKIVDEKYTNEFKIFLEKNDKEDKFLEEIKDEELLKVVVNNYLLNNIS